MSETKHSTAPWRTVNGKLVCSNTPGNQVVAECRGWNGEADACLIAAAPDLLEACEKMLSELRSLEASGGACIPSIHVCEGMYQAVEKAHAEPLEPVCEGRR